jgi:hypothetical protein
MAINGRINVDVLFHDTAGTTSLKVVSLEGSTEYTTGKVAVVTGTVGTSASVVTLAATGYKDASGSEVQLTTGSRLSFSASGTTLVKCQDMAGDLIVYAKGDDVSTSDMPSSVSSLEVLVDATAGTASYTLVLYGT